MRQIGRAESKRSMDIYSFASKAATFASIESSWSKRLGAHCETMNWYTTEMATDLTTIRITWKSSREPLTAKSMYLPFATKLTSNVAVAVTYYREANSGL